MKFGSFFEIKQISCNLYNLSHKHFDRIVQYLFFIGSIRLCVLRLLQDQPSRFKQELIVHLAFVFAMLFARSLLGNTSLSLSNKLVGKILNGLYSANLLKQRPIIVNSTDTPCQNAYQAFYKLLVKNMPWFK